MTFSDKKREYVDKEAYNILELFEETEEVQEESNSESGSLAHQIPIDWSDKVIDKPYLIPTQHLATVVAMKECYRGRCIGLNQENYKQLKKLVKAICKDKSFSSKVSQEFIEKKTFEWLLKTYKSKKADMNFSSYILDEIVNSIKELKIFFSILYLDIIEPFKIGNVKFEYFTKEYFDRLIENANNDNPNRPNSNFELLRDKYQGQVFATYTVFAEKEKAKEIAFEECSLAVDVLKMCSDTIEIPELKLSFDIDRRIKENDQNEVLISYLNNPKEFMGIDLQRIPRHHMIRREEWDRMLSRGLKSFNNFLTGLKCERTELEQLIINGIKRYGNVISNSNLHQRVVELYTILESLLLLDQNSPIIESVCKYCSKLVLKKAEDRKDLISVLKSMYKVRSSLIHHAKEIDFEIDNLRKLQIAVLLLLSSMIEKTVNHASKKSILEEIDNAILEAY